MPRLPKDGWGGGGDWWRPHLSPAWGRAGQKVLPWSDLLIRVVEPWDPVVSAGLWTHFVATLDKVQYNYCMHAAHSPDWAAVELWLRGGSLSHQFP